MGPSRPARRQRPSTAVDASVLVASYLPAHPAHAASLAAIRRVRQTEGRFILPLHAALETYAVLTRLPPPHRLAPGDADRLLRETCVPAARLAASLPPADFWPLLERLAEEQVAGGRVYDAAIVASAVRAGARRILTLNPRHFESVAPAGLAIVDPTPQSR